MSYLFSTRLSSWLPLPLKRKHLDYEPEDGLHQAKKQRTRKSENNVTKGREPLSSTGNSILHKQAMSGEHGMGWFVTLPIELLHMIYQLSDNDSLIVLASLSKHLNSSILQYLTSITGFIHLLKKKPFNDFKHVDRSLTGVLTNPLLFKDAGLTLGSISACLSITKRLRVASQIKEKIELKSSDFISTVVPSTRYQCYGQFFSNFVSEWSELDKKKAYCLFVKLMKLEQKISRILRFCPGTLPWHEHELRDLLLQTLLLPGLSDKDYGFWLTQILHPLPITHQARLLYILTGPTDHLGSICWYYTCGCIETCTTMVKTATRQYDHCDLSELARAFRILLVECDSYWSIDNIISIFNELTMIPCGWCLEKVANLLVKSGSALSRAILGNRALNGHMEELSLMMCHIAHVCFSPFNNNNMPDKLISMSDWYVDLLIFTVRQVSDKKEKKKLTKSLLSLWRDSCSLLFDASHDDHTTEFRRKYTLQFNNSLTTLTKLTNVLLDKLLDIPTK